MQYVKKDEKLLRELGNKLANFRKKLALAIGQKKITQPEFGEMFGGHSARSITSYERGEVDPPGSMFFLIWLAGISVDAIFGEGPLSSHGIDAVAHLYEQCALASVSRLDHAARDRALKEAEIGIQNNTLTKIIVKTPHKPAPRHHKARSNKRR